MVSVKLSSSALILKLKQCFKTPVLMLILFCTFYPATSLSQGTVVHDSLFSNSLGRYKKMNVYLPEGYNHDQRRYSAIYFLHGGLGDHNSFGFIHGILDSLISNQIIEPVILVKPDGSQGPYAGSFYTNSVLYGRYEDFIYIDVIEYIDRHYRTQANRKNRSIMGHSFGGSGSMVLALKHASLYRAVASHSGPLDFYHLFEFLPPLFAESGGSPPYSFAPFNGIFSLLLYTAAGAFVPNLLNPPFYVDFLVDVNGNIIPSVFERTIPHNPSHLSANINERSNLAIYFDCGLQDGFNLLGWNNGFRDSLEARNIPYTYETFTGGHGDKLPSRLAISLKFLDDAMKQYGHDNKQLAETDEHANPIKFKLYLNYPNPFNPVTKIKFDIPGEVKGQTAIVKLAVYDILGREIMVLVNEQLKQGKYEVEWNATGYPSGVYFYRLTAGNFTETKNMILVK